MWSEVKVREDVVLRLAHSAERSLVVITLTSITAEDLPIALANRRK
jgi:hypothetical protein